MTHLPPSLSAAVAAALLLAGCDAGDKAHQENAAPGPQVRITSPHMDQVLDGDQVQVMFDVRAYDVSVPKPVEGGWNPYLEGSGQHIHLIVDNQPYLAIATGNGKWDKGEPYVDANKNGAYDVGEPFSDYDVNKGILLEPSWMTPGTHVVRAFPSAGPNDPKGAKWHESRKNGGAFAWVRFHVKAKGATALQEFDPFAHPTLTYSRPKGEYVLGKADSKLLFPLLLDFYVTGCTLSKDGYRVRATLDGKATEYADWKPQTIAGDMPVGDHTVVLDLLDKDGKPVDGPFNHTERKITIK